MTLDERSIPIDPGRDVELYLDRIKELDTENEYRGEDTALVITNQVSPSANVFIVLREIARSFVNGTKWNKKACVVLEYDPQQDKMSITSFMERGEEDPPGADTELQD